MSNTSRRNFLINTSALLVASPALVRATSLDLVKGVSLDPYVLAFFYGDNKIVLLRNSVVDLLQRLSTTLIQQPGLTRTAALHIRRGRDSLWYRSSRVIVKKGNTP